MTPSERDTVPPSSTAVLTSTVLVAAAVLAAALIDAGQGFTPRVETLDALAGLSIGAFIVDRLLTFVPPVGARKPPRQRLADLKVLRLGSGAVLGAVFVSVTDLRAVDVLTSNSGTVRGGVDRGVAVLAIAGGVAGLARLLSGINPQPATRGDQTSDEPQLDESGTTRTIPPPSGPARVLGLAGLGLGALLALVAIHDTSGVEMLGPENSGDGTAALVIRFGLVLLAAAIVEQVAEVAGRVVRLPKIGTMRAGLLRKRDKPVVLGGLAVLLGVAGARLFDLYLLHNVGFFGATPGTKLGDALNASSAGARWGDTFLTGLVIAAGTKPLHDVASRLRKAKNPEVAATA